MPTLTTTHFRTRLTAYVVLSLFLICAIVSGLTIASQYSILKHTSKANLLQQVDNKRLVVHSYLRRILDLTQQLGSRSDLKHPLIAYSEGRLSQHELQQATGSHLLDGLQLIPEAVGILRLASDGTQAASVGLNVPQSFWNSTSANYGRAAEVDVVTIDQQRLVMVQAPILNNSCQVGTDIVLFQPPDFPQVFSGDPRHSQGATFLWDCTKQVKLIASPPELEPTIRHQLEQCIPLKKTLASLSSDRGFFELERAESPYSRTVTYARLAGGNWLLTTIVNQDSYYATMHQKLLPVLVIAVGLTLLGGAGMYLMLRPLTRQVLVESDDLTRINRSLQQEVAERQQAENELLTSEKEWATTFESITDAITILDSDSHIRKQNQAARRIGSSYGSALKEKPQRRNLVPISGYPSPLLEQAFEEQQRVQQIYHDEGTDSYFRITITPQYANRQLLGAVQLVHDISEQTRLEKMKSETIAAVSHEIRTPLTAIMGFVEFMQTHDTTEQERNTYFDTIQNEMRRLHELMNDFLDLQRLQSAVLPYHFDEVDLEMVLQQTINLFKMASTEHHVQFETGGAIPRVKGDATRLQQVFKNILANAVKYSPDGGTITVTLRSSQERVYIWVKDQGIGIPPQDLERIFNRFYRVDDSDCRIPGGLGLGLALVKEIITAHRGQVWAESTLGHGSTFFVELPANTKAS